MPLVVRGDDAPSIAQPSPARISSPQYKGITVDTKYIPVSAILNSLEGSNWIVQYYRQVLDDDNYLNGQMLNTEAVYQQYWLIQDFELKVSTPLSSSQNTETKEMQITGAGVVHPSLVPNVGDMFLADVGDGREGVFRVTSSEQRSIFKDTAHAIEYELIDYSTEERRADFQSKVIKVLHYVKDNNYYGQDPLIEEETYYLNRDLSIELRRLTKNYFDLFFSHEYQSMMLPNMEYPTYDHFLTKVVKRIFNTDDHLCIRHIRLMQVSDDKTLQAQSLYDAVIEKDSRYLLHAFETFGLVSAKSFSREPMMESVYHSGFNYLIYPKDNEVSVDYLLEKRQKDLELTVAVVPDENLVPDLEALIDLVTKDKIVSTAAVFLPQAMAEGYYVLSAAFYASSENQSKFELAVRDHIENRPVDKFLLKALCETYHAWGAYEKFYFTPILIMMIKSSIKE